MHVHARLGEVVGQDQLEDVRRALRLARRTSATPRCLAMYQSGNRRNSRSSSARSYSGSTPGRLASWMRTSASLAAPYRLAARALRRAPADKWCCPGRTAAGSRSRDPRPAPRGTLHAGCAEQARHLHERPAVLVLRRRIHHDPGAGRGGDAEVAAEARVLGGRGEAEGLAGEARAQPVVEIKSAAQAVALLTENFCAILSPNHTNKPRCHPAAAL